MQQQKSYNICFGCEKYFKSPNNIPHFLPKCGHSLCATCLISILELKEDNYMACPLCKQKFSSQNIEDFPVNLQLLPIIKSSQVQLVSNSICKKHNRCFEAFCKLEKKPICLTCLMDNSHRFHEIISLKEAISQEKVKILNFLQDTHTLKQKYENVNLMAFEKQREEISINYEESLDEIRDFFVKLHSFLNEKQTEIESDLLKEYKNKEKILLNRENDIKNAMNFIENYQEQYNEVKKLKDLEILTWSLEKEPEIEEIKSQIFKKFKEQKQSFSDFWKKSGKIEKTYREMGDFFREIEGKNKVFLGRVKLKGKENFSGSHFKSIENLHNKSQNSALKTKTDDASFLIEEQKKFHLKMLTFT